MTQEKPQPDKEDIEFNRIANKEASNIEEDARLFKKVGLPEEGELPEELQEKIYRKTAEEEKKKKLKLETKKVRLIGAVNASRTLAESVRALDEFYETDFDKLVDSIDRLTSSLERAKSETENEIENINEELKIAGM